MSDTEKAALKELSDAGYIAWDFREQNATNGSTRFDRYFVGAGSHGHSGPTLREAMIGCLHCCSIWKYWTSDDGSPIYVTFEDIAVRHLGGSLSYPEYEYPEKE